VAFNIFPPTKDSNQLNVTLGFAPGTSIDRAEQITDDASRIVASELGSNFDYSSQYGMANSHTSTLYVNLVPYDKRVATSPELVKKLNNRFESFTEARASATQIDVGPPASAFTVTVDASDRPKAIKLAEDIESYLKSVKLVRTDGSIAHTKDVHVEDPSVYVRIDGKSVISVSATFDGDDTTALTDLARTAVEEKYTPQVLSSFGVGKDAVSFELGQEQENQDSFKTLALAFPLVLIAIYILLAVQFRSLLQPLLIFMALPFSLFGVTLGLYLTDNAFSFFAMLGFFALIGLSIKNTILLTDYANQARRSGLSPIDSAVAALGERFRPLIATSITAVVSLIPLAVTSPFWQGLAVVLIFGLLSSTLLVVTIFPYFYLGAEYLRLRVSRRRFLKWFGLAIGLIIVITTLVRSL
jgi:multidrug efflux pump subunit AcrB